MTPHSVLTPSQACTLSYKTRIWGFVISFVLGYIIMFMSLLAVPSLGKNPEKFAILYTIGNIIAIGSSCFLWGPWSQVKNMFAKTRVIATVVYLLCIGITIWLAVDVKKTVPILMMIIIQCFAGIWYALSYIPVRTRLAMPGLPVMGNAAHSASGALRASGPALAR